MQADCVLGCGPWMGGNSLRHAELVQDFGRCVSASCGREAGSACADGGARWAQYTLEWSIRQSGSSSQGSPYMAGWCNGSAGFVFLWTLAPQMIGRPEFARLAEV